MIALMVTHIRGRN